MSHSKWFRPALAALATGAMVGSGHLAEAQQRIERLQARFQEAPARERRGDADRQPPASDYWIGLECYPVDDALRAQLELPADQGLLVANVVPESPGAKAGIKQYDVLVKAGDQALTDVAELVGAIRQAKDSEFAVELIRGGKPRNLKVTPAKREEAQADVLRRLPQGDLGELRRWMESIRPGQQQGPWKYRVLGPGIVLPGGNDKPQPKDMSITIQRKGGEPASISVAQGDKSWETTADKLDELPDEVRQHVERLLGRGMPLAAPGMPGQPAPGVGRAFPDATVSDRLEAQLKQMNEQLEALRRQVESMQKNLPK